MRRVSAVILFVVKASVSKRENGCNSQGVLAITFEDLKTIRMGADGIMTEHVGTLAPGLLLIVIGIFDDGCGLNASEP